MVSRPNIRKRERALDLPPSNIPGVLRNALPEMAVQYLPIGGIKPPTRQLRKHTPEQVTRLAASFRKFGMVKPILIDPAYRIVAGYAMYLAAKEVGMDEVPTVSITHLTSEQLRLYAIADNKLSEMSSFDLELLAVEFQELQALDIDLDITGFQTYEIDSILNIGTAGEGKAEQEPAPSSAPPVSRLGDLWVLGRHRLLCGNACLHEDYVKLMGNERARMICTDMPYNVAIAGNVSGLGKTKHTNFVMASGEMTRPEFTTFLTSAMRNMADFSADGSIHFCFMDWRHQLEMMQAGEAVYHELKNLIVWSKGTGGMGTFYRSQHELIYCWKRGTAKHVNNFGLGEHGRYRTNVITMPGCNSFSSTRTEALAEHSTPKPIALISDLILDVSHRRDLVLDPFTGSGTAILAAERTGRRAYGIELDPKYVDLSVRRWEEMTGQKAIHVETGLTLHALADARALEIGEPANG